MANSLQEQLLKAGLVDSKTAKNVKKEKNKQARQTRRTGDDAQDAEQWAKEAREEKRQKDLALNKKANEEAQRKAIAAQIVQLVSSNQIRFGDGDVGYQFADQGKVKKLYVTAKIQEQLANGVLAIARSGSGYALIPKLVAEKIMERGEGTVVLLNQLAADAPAVEEDPYADYQIPDDLMW